MSDDPKPWWTERCPIKRAAAKADFETRHEWREVASHDGVIEVANDLGHRAYRSANNQKFGFHDEASRRAAFCLAQGPWRGEMPRGVDFFLPREGDSGFVVIRRRNNRRTAVALLPTWLSFRVALEETK